MIQRVFTLARSCSRDLMVPVAADDFLSAHTPVAEVLERAQREKRLRFPVLDRETGECLGVVRLRDLWKEPGEEDKAAREFVRKVPVLAEETPADEVIPQMRLAGQSVALVRDGSNRITGLLTAEDVIQRVLE